MIWWMDERKSWMNNVSKKDEKMCGRRELRKEILTKESMDRWVQERKKEGMKDGNEIQTIEKVRDGGRKKNGWVEEEGWMEGYMEEE